MQFVFLMIGVFVLWFLGLFGGSQIVGSIQYRKERSPGMTATTILIWSVLLCVAGLAVYFWFFEDRIVLWIALGFGCVLSIRSQKR